MTIYNIELNINTLIEEHKADLITNQCVYDSWDREFILGKIDGYKDILSILENLKD